MITAFVGTIYEESDTPISGNGKTGSMVGIAALDHFQNGKTIWSNFHTGFSECKGFQEMIDTIGNEEHPELILCVSEMQNVLNSLGSSTKQVLFIDKFCSQLRKLKVDLYWDTQRFRNVHLRLRTYTDVILIPIKCHFDGSQCNYNLCKKPHQVLLYSYKPAKDKPIVKFNMCEVGKLYDTNEIIYDQLKMPKKED